MNRMPSLRVFIPTLALTALLTGLVLLLSHDADRTVMHESPGGSVQRFLEAVGSGDGDAACGYLSIPQQRRVERAAGRHVSCSDAFIDARFDLARTNYLDDLGGVHFAGSRNGKRATVVATRGSATTQFTLAPVTEAAIEQQRYQPPSTNWRITSGATTLVRPVP